jgi:hypothetical protein
MSLNKPQLFVSIPQRVEAVQWKGDKKSFREILKFGAPVKWAETGGLLLLAGKGGAQDWVPVPVLHWIVRPEGDMSDHWPADSEYFTKKYVTVET